MKIKKNNKELQKFYDKVYSKGEQKHFTSFVLKGTATSEVKEIIKENVWKGKKVLDVGCGTGFFSNSIAKLGANVTGIDFSQSAILIAKKMHSHPNLEFRQLDVSNINEKFDVIVSIGTLEHMDEPLEILKKMKKNLTPKGKIIITSPNWTNPRGYVLMTLLHLFDAPITLADLHYQTPKDFEKYAKKLNMKMKWRTFDKSWAHGEILIKDFQRRLPNVLKDTGFNVKPKKIESFITWLEENVSTFNNDLPHSGAIGLYTFSKKNKIILK